MAVINRIAEFHDEMTGWRRHLHEHPELGFQEIETARFVADKLRGFGVDEVHVGLGKTGVVAVIHGADGDRRIGLRADMDALPILERSGKPWASKTAGRMHACGHDGHTAMLLGAARYLAETRNFAGTAYLYFQPAEEGLGGAKAMIDDGLFERFPAEQVFGMHNWPDLPVGEFAMRPGPAMAAADRFTIELQGVGCHGAMPHQGKDPVVAASLLVLALQSIVSRQIDPIDNAVLSVTTIHGGDAYNVVPDRVELKGTVRTYQKATQDFIVRRMGETVDAIAAAQGMTGSLKYDLGYPATVNALAEARLGADAAREIVGDANVHWDHPPCMGAEDFAYMLEQKPGSYIWMGNGGGEQGKVCHSPFYDFNDEALPVGVSYWARLVERLLPRA